MAAVPSDAYALSMAPPADARANLGDRADHFVTRHPWIPKVRELTLFDDGVAVAHAARLDADEHLMLARTRHVTFDGDKLTAGALDLHRSHREAFQGLS